MKGCEAEPYLSTLRVPILLMRPRSEMELGPDYHWIRRQYATWQAQGAESHIVDDGVHGSSMMSPSRVGRGATSAWTIVFSFLDRSLRSAQTSSAQDRRAHP